MMEPSRTMQPLKVLVVDDSLITVNKLKRMLTELGHRVVRTASTGMEALTAYAECHPDVVTMDITMPDMDGIEATKHILLAHPEAVIIMVTSHGQEPLVLEAMNAGCRGYVLKPFRAEKLCEVIDRVVERYLTPKAD